MLRLSSYHCHLGNKVIFLCCLYDLYALVLACECFFSAHAAIATRATQMVEKLSEENRSLRQELKDYYKKVSKLEKVSCPLDTLVSVGHIGDVYSVRIAVQTLCLVIISAK